MTQNNPQENRFATTGTLEKRLKAVEEHLSEEHIRQIVRDEIDAHTKRESAILRGLPAHMETK